MTIHITKAWCDENLEDFVFPEDGREFITLTNENLKVGDKVFPISHGRIIENEYIHEKFDYGYYTSGFPTSPDTILDLNYSRYKPYQIRTDSGYGPIEKYYKIVENDSST